MLLWNTFIITTILTFSTTITTTTSLTMSTTVKTTTPAPDRRPTMRSISSTLSILSSPSYTHLSSESIDKRVSLMVERAKNGESFTEEEIDDIEKGLQNLSPIVDNTNSDDNSNDSPQSIDFAGLRILLNKVAHLSHKDWDVTSKNSDLLRETLSIGQSSSSSSSNDDVNDSNYPLGSSTRQLLERILTDGNWDGAVENARERSQLPPANDNKSWAVLVTGVNGIRKTTSIYQPWFSKLLSEALVEPTPSLSSSSIAASSPTEEEGMQDNDGNKNKNIKPEEDPQTSSKILCDNLPVGSNSFFRQLDHMICTLCNEEFARLYAWSDAQLPKAQHGEEKDRLVEQYSDYKVRTSLYSQRYCYCYRFFFLKS
jgi:hypothetical protein